METTSVKAGTLGMIRVSASGDALIVKKITRTSVIPFASIANVTTVPAQVLVVDSGGSRTVINAWNSRKVARFIDAARQPSS